jgi:hypothetical protein
MAFSACIGPYDRATKYGDECRKNRGGLEPSNIAASHYDIGIFYSLNLLFILHKIFNL